MCGQCDDAAAKDDADAFAREGVIVLHHYERGPMRVHVWDEATWWMRTRQWTCFDDPELGSFEDGDFDETKEQIDALLQPSRQARD